VIAGTYNMTCDQGSTFLRTFVVQYQDEIDPTVFHPYDLAGYTARMHIRRDVESTEILASLTTENGKITIDEADGAVVVSMTAEQTSAITRSGVYDIEIISPSQEVHKIVRGSFNLNLEVTR
jgi:hypothetical protein